jgi:hypothetical protein
MVMQPRTSHRVSGPVLWAALDRRRTELGISWREVARQTGCTTASLFTRMQHDDLGMHADTLVTLLAWLGHGLPVDGLVEVANHRV